MNYFGQKKKNCRSGSDLPQDWTRGLIWVDVACVVKQREKKCRSPWESLKIQFSPVLPTAGEDRCNAAMQRARARDRPVCSLLII